MITIMFQIAGKRKSGTAEKDPIWIKVFHPPVTEDKSQRAKYIISGMSSLNGIQNEPKRRSKNPLTSVAPANFIA